MYETDSFHTLAGSEQLGLLAVSALFAGGMIWVVRRAARPSSAWKRAAISGSFFYCFVWLSPQGYYAYYWTIIDDLPRQIVVGPPPSLPDVFGLLFFSGPQTLSAHSLGILGWFMLLTALWPHRSNCRDAAN